MADKKAINKTVNRTGKSLVKKALVVKAKKAGILVSSDKDKIKKLNEKVAKEKELQKQLENEGENQAVVKKEVVKAKNTS